MAHLAHCQKTKTFGRGHPVGLRVLNQTRDITSDAF
jgi:hypothetical protein